MLHCHNCLDFVCEYRCCHCGCFSGKVQYHKLIISALNRFIKDDTYLFEKDLNERAQTHKIAEYLQHLLPDYNVDCEYNKKLNTTKTLDFDYIVQEIKNFVDKNKETTKNNNIFEILRYAFGWNEISELRGIFSELAKDLDNPVRIADESDVGTDFAGSFLEFSTSKNNSKKYVKRVFPDIIAHMRGRKNNKIVIEAKKASNRNDEAKIFDIIKLNLFTQIPGQYDYCAGYFVELPSGPISDRFTIDIRQCNLIPSSNVFVVRVVQL